MGGFLPECRISPRFVAVFYEPSLREAHDQLWLVADRDEVPADADEKFPLQSGANGSAKCSPSRAPGARLGSFAALLSKARELGEQGACSTQASMALGLFQAARNSLKCILSVYTAIRKCQRPRQGTIEASGLAAVGSLSMALPGQCEHSQDRGHG